MVICASYSMFEWNWMIKEFCIELQIYRRTLLSHFLTMASIGITVSVNNHRSDRIAFYRSFSGYPGNHSGNHFETSGAYVFRPLISHAQPVGTTRNM